MKMKNLFKFFCLMTAMIIGQMAWAEGIAPVEFRWSSGDLNSINTEVQPSQFEKTTSDGLLKVVLNCNDHDVDYHSGTDYVLLTSRFLSLGHIQAGVTRSGAISWAPAQAGYAIVVDSIDTETKIAGTNCYFSLNGGAEKRVDVGYGTGWVHNSTAVASPATTSVPFYFRGADNRGYADYGEGAAINGITMRYQVFPAAPVWVDGVKNSFVTVDTTNIHWYCPGDSAKALLPAFDDAVKVEVEFMKGSQKYLFWNEDHTKFFMLKPMEFAMRAWVEATEDFNGSDTISVYVKAEIPQETPHIFFFVDDEWVRDVNMEGNNYINFLVTLPAEHFVEYVCAAKGDVKYIEKSETCLTYMDSVRVRRDYFWMKQTEGSDKLTVNIGPAQSTLQINAVGLELNRVPFRMDSTNQASLITYAYDAAWRDRYNFSTIGYSFQGDSAIFFDYEYPLFLNTVRQIDVTFVGIPDSVFFDYGNDAGDAHASCVFKAYYATTESGNVFTELVTIQDQPAEDVHNAFALPVNANRLRFTYTGVQHPGWVKNLIVTERKELKIANDTIKFGIVKRAPGKVKTMTDSLTWINLFPELRYTTEEPFSADGRIRVRFDEYDLVPSHNKFQATLDMDTVGDFVKTLKIASMDVTRPIFDTCILITRVTFDENDMFIKLSKDTVRRNDSAYITVEDKLGTVLKHDSLHVHYAYAADSLNIDAEGKVTASCVGGHMIIVTVDSNSLVPAPMLDTLYIYTPEDEANVITFSIPEEIGVHDTLVNLAVSADTASAISYVFAPADCMEALADGRVAVGKMTYGDSVMVYATASSTCDHFEVIDSAKVWLRGVVRADYPEYGELFGYDTIKNVLNVYGEDGALLNSNPRINISYDLTPATYGNWLGKDTLHVIHAGQITIKDTISGDSIKTLIVDTTLWVNYYTIDTIIIPEMPERGYYYVGETIPFADFHCYAKERDHKELKDIVKWNFTFDEPEDAHVMPNNDIVCDSIRHTTIKACVDVDTTIILEPGCNSKYIIIEPAIPDHVVFPDQELYIVGDSLAVDSIRIIDVIGNDITGYAEVSFSFGPKFLGEVAHLSEDGKFIVFDQHGLDTVYVHVAGDLVQKKDFWQRFIVAPVLAAKIDFPEGPFAVLDTIWSKDIKVYNMDNEDITRYSNITYRFDKGVAQAIEGGIVLTKGGEQVITVVTAKPNNMSMVMDTSFARFPQNLNVAAIEAVRLEGIEDAYTVYDILDTKAIKFFDAQGRDITKLAKPSYTIDEAKAVMADGKISFRKSGEMNINVKMTGKSVSGDLNKQVNINKYAVARVLFRDGEFVVGDEVSIKRWILICNEADKHILPVADYQLTFSFDENDAHWNADKTAIVLDKTVVDVTIGTTAESEIMVDPAFAVTEINAARTQVDYVQFPGEDHFVGEEIAIADLTYYDASHRDITVYAKNELQGFAFANGLAHATADKIIFDKAGNEKITTTVGGVELLIVNQIKSQLYIGQVTPASVELAKTTFIVGEQLKKSDVKVFMANGEEITNLCDIALTFPKGLAHYTDNFDIEFDAITDPSADITINVIGLNSAKTAKINQEIIVNPIEAEDVVLPAGPYTVFGSIDLNDVIVSAIGKDITKYATLTYDITGAATQLRGTKLYFLEAGEVQIAFNVSGNAYADAPIMKVLTVNAYTNVSIAHEHHDYYVADEVALSEFKVIDNATGKRVLASYELAISCDPARGTKSGDNIILDKAGETFVNVSLASSSQIAVDPAQFALTVNRAHAGELYYKTAGAYKVGDVLNVENFVLVDSINRDITQYADGAYMNFVFTPANAVYDKAAGTITINEPGKTHVTAYIGNEDIAPATLGKIWAIEQLEATSITCLQENFIVGDTMGLSNFQVWAGDQDITALADLRIYSNADEGHKLSDGAIVFDKQGNIAVQILIVGQKETARQSFTKTFAVAPIAATAIEGLNSTYTVFNRFDTKSLVVKAGDRDITNYAELTFALSNDNASIQDGIISFDKAGSVDLTVTVGGNATGSFVLPISINKNQGASIRFKGGEYYVADQVLLSDFVVVNAAGQPYRLDYSLSISCDANRGTKVGDNIILDKAGQTFITVTLAENEQIAIDPTPFEIIVKQANAVSVVYGTQGNYKVGDVLNVSDFVVLDSINRDITRYAENAFMSFDFNPNNATYDRAAGTITINEAGKTVVTAHLGNDEIAAASIYHVWAVDQLIASSATFAAGPYYVGDTLHVADIHIFKGEEDITANADPFFIINNLTDGHFLANGDLVFDKVDSKFDLTIAIKGYDNVGKVDFPNQINVLPRAAASVVLPTYVAQVLDSLETKDVVVLDAFGNDITKYATLSYSFDNNAAKMIGTKIVFYKNGPLTINVTVAGNAAGQFAPVVNVYKNSTAQLTTPADNWFVGDKIYLDQFDLVDANGNKFDAEYSLSFEIAAADGRKLDDNTIVFDNAGNVNVNILISGEVTMTGKNYVAHVKQCVANGIIFPKVDYIVGDSLAIADLKVVDAKNSDITRYVEYKGFVFDPADCATFDLAKGYIYFKAPGTVKVATTVGGALMADGTLNSRISIDQAAVASVTLPKQVYTVGDTLDIKDVKAFDAQGVDMTIYSDLYFVFKDEAHFVQGTYEKIVLDKAGANTIKILVNGREGVELNTLNPVMTVNPVAVAKVEILGSYKVTDMIYTDAVKVYAANGLDITRYVAYTAYQFEAGVAHAQGEGFVLDKSGDQNISVILSGDDIVAATKVVVLNIAKCVAVDVLFPETKNNEYRVGDVIYKSDFEVYDADANDITRYAELSFTFVPASAATVNAQGNIVVKETGNLTITVHVSGDVEDASFSENYFVRHNTKDVTKIYDIMVRPWSDEIMISNTTDTLPTFVSYIWYKDEVVIDGQTTQIYNVPASEADGMPHVYYAIAFDAQGNQYLIAEKTYIFNYDAGTGRIVEIYPSKVAPAAPYTIETSVAGEVRVTNSNGSTMEHFSVEGGKNIATAPMIPGVYVVHYVNADGEVATQKLIVK